MFQVLKRILIVTLSAISIPLFVSWGIYGHEHINHAAVLALPEPLQQFFYNHIDFITQESTIPDLRKYTLSDKAEKPRHYINLESYGGLDSLSTSKDYLKKYDEKTLSVNGILPWYLEEMMGKLTKAFKEKRKTEILFLAADLGHYIADAHMPLHTTINHDGEQSNQKGIHAFWEAQLPDLFGDTYNYRVEPLKYSEDVPKEIRSILRASHKLVDTLLLKEKQLSETYSAEKIYEKDAGGKILKNKFGQSVHTNAYAKAYHDALNGMVERQIRNSITATAGFWYTAWINAGKPDLSDLDAKEVTGENKTALKHELALLALGKLYGLASEKEFEH